MIQNIPLFKYVKIVSTYPIYTQMIGKKGIAVIKFLNHANIAALIFSQGMFQRTSDIMTFSTGFV